MVSNNYSEVYKKITEKLSDLQIKKFHSKYWNITWRQGVFLSNFVELNKPKRILEIGTSNGYSTLFLAKNALDSQIYTIEVNPGRLKEAKDSFNYCGLDNIKTINGNVLDVLSDLDLGGGFDLVFLDAAHKEYKKVFDLLLEKNFFNDNSFLICDNVISHNMEEFIAYMKSKYVCELIDMDGGFLIVFIS